MTDAQSQTPAEMIPEALRNRIGPDAPRRMRMLVARAQMPMPPSQLGVALAVLARESDREIADAAVASMRDLPQSVVRTLAASPLHGSILDIYARVLSNDVELLRSLLRNEAVDDSTIVWMAGKLRGPIIANIGANQRRFLRCPDIIAALIKNPATPTPTMALVLETAIRNGVDINTVRGARALAEGFFGDVANLLGNKQSESRTRELALEETAVDEAVLEQLIERGSMSFMENQGGAKTEDAEKDEIPETTEASDEADTSASELLDAPTDSDPPETVETEILEEETKKSLWTLVNSMNMAQKVKLAMLGDVNARKLLIRDPKKTVSMTVLRSPRLTEKEIATFAKNKSLSEDIIRFIARHREWTRSYAIRLSLVYNPKCPANIATGFIKQLRSRDVQKLARAKDVPAYVIRAAKTLSQKRGGG